MARSNVVLAPKPVRCAIYTRKSTEEGLNQAFNSLDAQREAAEAYIVSQRHDGWTLVPTQYSDGSRFAPRAIPTTFPRGDYHSFVRPPDARRNGPLSRLVGQAGGHLRFLHSIDPTTPGYVPAGAPTQRTVMHIP